MQNIVRNVCKGSSQNCFPSILSFFLFLPFIVFFENHPFQTFLVSKKHLFIHVKKLHTPLLMVSHRGGGVKVLADTSVIYASFYVLPLKRKNILNDNPVFFRGPYHHLGASLDYQLN